MHNDKVNRIMIIISDLICNHKGIEFYLSLILPSKISYIYNLILIISL